MGREIKLSGGEISMLKALGTSSVAGKMLVERMQMDTAEFIDVLEGLISQGFVMSSKVNVMKMEDVERASFRINPAHARDLKDAMNPSRKAEDRPRRRRG